MTGGSLGRTLVALAVAFAAALAASLPAGAQGTQCRGPNDDVGNPCPDLSIAPEIDYVVDGFTIIFVVNVLNRGEVASPESTVSMTSLQLAPESVALEGIEPGGSQGVRISARVPETAQGQADRVTFTVDPDGQIDEPNKQDNRRTRSITLPTAAVVTETVTTTVTETEPGETGSVVTETVTQTETETVTTGPSDGGSDDALTWILLGTGAVLAILGGAAALYGLRARRSPVAAPPKDEPPVLEESAPPPAPFPAPPRAPSPAPPAAAAPPPPSAAPPPPVAANGGGGHPSPDPVPERYVNTGFATTHEPGTPLSTTTALQPGAPYLFWLEVGELVEGSIEETPVELTEIAELPAESRLDVVLYRVGDEATASQALAQGELRIAPEGSVLVSRQASEDIDLRGTEPLRDRRLFFPVEAPAAEGTMQLRCSIYHKQVLLQSRLVTARVVDTWDPIEDALRSELDFTLAPRLDAGHLNRLPEYSLSVLLNRGEDGTHSLTVKGKTFSDAATFDPVELETLVGRARKALRKAAWDNEDEWKEGIAYRYVETSPDKLRRDLATLAVWGIRFYAAICDRLAGDHSLEDLEEATREPGFVQIALKQSPRHLLPAATLYDYLGLSDTADIDEYELCAGFLDALEKDEPLGDSPCFKGGCPSRGQATTVCPSGFWGYRHALGIPATLQGAPDAPLEIEYQGAPSLSVAVSTDPQFVLRAEHEDALRALRPDLRYAASLADTLALLKDPSGQVLYFYCHGGLDKDVPYFRVGAKTEDPITAVTLLNQRVRWDAPRPLVFLNGCHTTGLEPELALEFVSALVRRSRAAGVIGTEITVFEPLARAFAEDCLQRFLSGEELGWAIRNARLGLLKAGNPLGLVYLPYALPSLKLVAR